MISVIIPVLNEALQIPLTLEPLQPLRGKQIEVIVVDGGSDDETVLVATPLADKILHSHRGRAKQMNLGAAQATGTTLLFLHADTCLPSPLDQTIQSITDPSWGRFNVQLNDPHWMYKIIAKMMNWRSCITGIATGDQAMFVKRDLFERLGGFADIPLMEDIELSRRLLKLGRPSCLRKRVLVSTRYWQNHGMILSVIKMWLLRSAYFLGVSPHRLMKIYYCTDS